MMARQVGGGACWAHDRCMKSLNLLFLLKSPTPTKCLYKSQRKQNKTAGQLNNTLAAGNKTAGSISCVKKIAFYDVLTPSNAFHKIRYVTYYYFTHS